MEKPSEDKYAIHQACRDGRSTMPSPLLSPFVTNKNLAVIVESLLNVGDPQTFCNGTLGYIQI